MFGVTSDDHTIVVRTGISTVELSGRTWRPINLAVNPFNLHDADGSPDTESGSIISSNIESSTDSKLMKFY